MIATKDNKDRERGDNSPTQLNVSPVPTPKPKDLGTLSRYTHEIIAGGPRALIAAEHKAAKLAQKLGVEVEARWCLTTEWLKQRVEEAESLDRMERVGELNRGHARAMMKYALAWRPRFLAALALSRSQIFAARSARISPQTASNHRKWDAEFDAQCCAAEEYAVQLLNDVAMMRAIEGDCEPVFWQRKIVGHVRKYDSRLQIEMLRAYRPKVFKTPGTKVAIATGVQVNNVIVDDEKRAELIAMRQESLRRMAAARGLPAPAQPCEPTSQS